MTGALVKHVALAAIGPLEAQIAAHLDSIPGVTVVRRCADLADLVGLAASRQIHIAVLSAESRGLDAEVFERLARYEVRPIVLVEGDDPVARRRWHHLGVDALINIDVSDESNLLDFLTSAIGGVSQKVEALHKVKPPDDAQRIQAQEEPLITPSVWENSIALKPGNTPGVAEVRVAPLMGSGGLGVDTPESATPRNALGSPPCRDDDRSEHSFRELGQVVAVWGPTGAPGRTTMAIGIAAEAAVVGHDALVVDADTYSGSIAHVLGLLDESPGLAAAARAADHGVLNVAELSRHAPVVFSTLRVLTGISRSHRWPELRPTALLAVLKQARALAAWTVVDTGFCLEQDEELVYDTAAPRRNGATIATLEEADAIVAVGSADPVGLQRLVRGLQELSEITTTKPTVVVNRVRSSAVGHSPQRRIRDALLRYADINNPVFIPDDVVALDSAVLAGQTLPEHGPTTASRKAIRQLAISLGVASSVPEWRAKTMSHT
ncbi:MAG: AAA family ATPase [Actinomycetota bacterium]